MVDSTWENARAENAKKAEQDLALALNPGASSGERERAYINFKYAKDLIPKINIKMEDRLKILEAFANSNDSELRSQAVYESTELLKKEKYSLSKAESTRSANILFSALRDPDSEIAFQAAYNLEAAYNAQPLEVQKEMRKRMGELVQARKELEKMNPAGSKANQSKEFAIDTIKDMMKKWKFDNDLWASRMTRNPGKFRGERFKAPVLSREVNPALQRNYATRRMG